MTVGLATKISGAYHGWYIVGCAFLIALFGWGLGFYGLGVYLNALQQKHGWPIATMSYAVTGYYLVSAALIIFVGSAIQRFGARRVVIGGSLALAVSISLLGVVSQLWQVYAAFICMSFGWAAMSGAAINTIIAPWFAERRGKAVSVALNGASVGGILIVPSLVFSIVRLEFHVVMVGAAAIMLLILIPVVLLVLKEQPPGESASFAESDRSASAESADEPTTIGSSNRLALLRSPAFLTISIPFAVGLAVQVGFLTHQVPFLSGLIGTEAAAIGVSITTVAAVIGRVGTGLFIDRVNIRFAASGNFILQLVALWVLLVGGSTPLLYMGCFMFGLAAGNMITLPALIVHREFSGKQFAQVISLVVAVNQFTFAFGPGVVGTLRQRFGDYDLVLFVAMAVLGMAATIVLFRSKTSLALP